MVRVATEAKLLLRAILLTTEKRKTAELKRQYPRSKNSEDVVPESSSDRDEEMSDTFTSPIDQLRNTVLNSLLIAVYQLADESACWDAVNWAIDQNLAKTNESTLLDKYLSSYYYI
jgi:hypothetical protein